MCLTPRSTLPLSIMVLTLKMELLMFNALLNLNAISLSLQLALDT